MCRLEKQVRSLAERASVEILYVFGSRADEVLASFKAGADGLAADPSDLDIGVLLPGGGWSVQEKVDFAQSLEVQFGVERVDLVVLNEADPFLAAEIIRGERLYERDRRFVDEYELFVLRRAGDLAPFEQERIQRDLTGLT
ncbi:MAG: nucleotidyltransferase domain-containing protein [Candidatus Aminicenantes bacterium]|nr:nucleotidyltransferase domain-containing protein [Candidatus Aminicenantes bacterium]